MIFFFPETKKKIKLFNMSKKMIGSGRFLTGLRSTSNTSIFNFGLNHAFNYISLESNFITDDENEYDTFE